MIKIIFKVVFACTLALNFSFTYSQSIKFSGYRLGECLTWQMIYEQPVLYEFNRLSMPVLFIVGEKDRTILGKNLLRKDDQKLHGNFPVLASEVANKIKNAKVIVIPSVGHIPRIQTTAIFNTDVLGFLTNDLN